MSTKRDIARRAIEGVRETVRWKPGKGLEHLAHRIARGHLPPSASYADYESIIGSVLRDDGAEVFIYDWRGTSYPCVVANVRGQPWLVMVSRAGIMETAFLIDVDGYLAKEAFTRLGTLKELA